MALRASEVLAGKTSRVDGVALNRKSGRQKALLVIFAEKWIASQVGVLRNPEKVFWREVAPTVSASYLAAQTQPR